MWGCTQNVSDISVGTIKNNKKCLKFLIKLIQSFFFFLRNQTRSLGPLLETTKPNTIELNEHQREPREQCPPTGLQSMRGIQLQF